MGRSGLAAAILVLAATAAPAAKLEIRDIQAADGQFGPARKTLVFYPNDEVMFRYNIAGIQVDDDGKANGQVAIKLKDDRGTVLLNETSAITGVVALGGGTLPGIARLTLSNTVAPGGALYAMKGVHPDEELAELPDDVEVVSTTRLDVPGLDGARHLVVLRPR